MANRKTNMEDKKMTVKQRLNEIKKLIKFKLYHIADKKVDALYEDFCSDNVKMTNTEEEQMFYYIDLISQALYC